MTELELQTWLSRPSPPGTWRDFLPTGREPETLRSHLRPWWGEPRVALVQRPPRWFDVWCDICREVGLPYPAALDGQVPTPQETISVDGGTPP